MRAWWGWWVLVVGVAGCATSGQGPRFRWGPGERLPDAGTPVAELEGQLGPAVVMQGHGDGTETFFYFDTRRKGCTRSCVRVLVAQGRVLSAARTDAHPPYTTAEGQRPARPVGDGAVRLGQTEDAVRASLGAPTGITAARGVETWHYLTTAGLPGRVRIDSRVRWRQGRVIAYEDRYVDGYDPRLPQDTDGRPSSGRVRVGMTAEEVAPLVGPPDQVVSQPAHTLHIYAYPALVPGLTSEVTEQIVYRRGRVDGIVTVDHTLAAERARIEARRDNWRFLLPDE